MEEVFLVDERPNSHSGSDTFLVVIRPRGLGVMATLVRMVCVRRGRTRLHKARFKSRVVRGVFGMVIYILCLVL